MALISIFSVGSLSSSIAGSRSAISFCRLLLSSSVEGFDAIIKGFDFCLQCGLLGFIKLCFKIWNFILQDFLIVFSLINLSLAPRLFLGISLLLLFRSANQFINELDNFAELFVVILLFNDMWLNCCHHQWLRFLSLVWAPCHHPLLLQYLHFHSAGSSYRLQSCQSRSHTTPFCGISLLLVFRSASQSINELDNFVELVVVMLLIVFSLVNL